MRRARTLILAALAALLCAPAGAAAASADRLALQPADVPGLSPVSAGRGGEATLALEVTAPLRIVRVDASAFRSGATRVEFRAFAYRDTGAATRSLTAWRKALGARAVDVDGATGGALVARRARTGSELLVAFRRGATVGLVRQRAPLARNAARPLALAYAGALADRLERVGDRSAVDRVADGVRADGSVPLPTLLQLAALTFGPVDGVTLPRGDRSELPPFDATVVLEQLVAAARAMSPAQRRAIDEAIRGDVPPAPAPPTARRLPRSGPSPCPATADRHPLDRVLTAEAVGLRDLMATLIGTPATWSVCLYRYPTGVEAGAAAVTSTWSTSLPGTPVAVGELDRMLAPVVTYNECFVRVLPLYTTVTPQNQRFELAHEMYHCLHKEWGRGLLDDPGRINAPWVEEAMANWAAHQIAAGAYEPRDQIPGVFIDRWYDEWRTALFSFRYSAWGFFGLVEQLAGAPAVWGRVIPMWSAGADSPAAFAAAVGSNGPEVLNAWGPGLFRQSAFPRPWLQRLPILVPATTDPAAGKDVVSVGEETLRLTTTGYRSSLYAIHGGARPVLNVTLDGFGHLTDGRTDWDRPRGLWLCLRECACPPGQHLRSSAPTWTTVEHLYAGLAAAAETSTLTLEPHAMAEYCEPDPPPPPSGPGSGHGPGSATTHNDPHLVTYDGLAYDLQAAGELVLARTADGAFEVQARQEPVAETRLATSNTAVAARVSGHRIGIYGGDDVTVRVDGVRTALPQDSSLDVGGARLRHVGPVYTVRWPDGSELSVDAFRPNALRITLHAADGLLGQLTGILGSNNGNPNDDLVTRGGDRLPYTTLGGDLRVPMIPSGVDDFKWLHGPYADSWRVTGPTSLFDYERGRSTATFTDRTMPRRELTLAQLSAAVRALARRACAGIAQPWFRSSCERDVAVTRDTGYAAAAKRAEADRNGWRTLEGFELRIGPLSAATAADGSAVFAAQSAVFGSELLATAVVVPPDSAPLEPVVLERGFVGDPVLHRSANGTVAATLPVTDVFGTGLAAVRTYELTAAGAMPGPDVVTAPNAPRGGAPAAAGPAGLLTVADWLTGLGVVAGTGATGTGAAVPSDGTDCPTSAPSLATGGGAVWLAWTATLCTASGPRVVAVDPVTGASGQPLVAPGALTGQLLPNVFRTPLAVRPDGDAVVAYAGDRRVLVWHPGDAAPIEVARTGQRTTDLALVAAEPGTGRIWVAWRDPGKGSLQVRRSEPDGRAFGPVRTIEPPVAVRVADRFAGDWALTAADGEVTVAYSIPGRSTRPGNAWFATLR